MKKRVSKKIMCGDVAIGGDAPVSIQSMTNTDTRDIIATVNQIRRLKDAGCQIVRVAVPDMEAAEALKSIKKQAGIPVVADIHFDYRLAIEAIRNGADKIRINPGNIGGTERIRAVVEEAKKRNIPIRIGVNSGSLEKDIIEKYGRVTPEGLAESALRNVEAIEKMDFSDIVVSLKASDVRLNYEAHIIAAGRISYPIHIGITESGTAKSGIVKSAVGIGSLLLCGIGDTVRVSLTGDPVNEIYAAREILMAAGIRQSGINIVSCPTCGRCAVDLERIAGNIEDKLKYTKKNLTVAIMGCEVNGPGEAKEADIGIACGKGKAVLFKKGRIEKTVKIEEIEDELINEIENFS